MNDKKSTSIFSERGDGSSAVIEENWRKEASRRRKFMIRIAVPVVLVLLAAWLIPAKKFQFFPFEIDYKAIREANEAKAKAEHMKGRPVKKEGNPDAKMHMNIVLYPGNDTPYSWSIVLNEVLDTRPSEIYIETSETHRSNDPELKKLFDDTSSEGFVINGKHVFTFTSFRGVTKTVDSISKNAKDVLDVDLAYILNDEYKRIYGTDKDLYDAKSITEAAKSDVLKKQNGPEHVVMDEKELSEEDKIDGAGIIVLPGLEFEADKKDQNNAEGAK